MRLSIILALVGCAATPSDEKPLPDETTDTGEAVEDDPVEDTDGTGDGDTDGGEPADSGDPEGTGDTGVPEDTGTAPPPLSYGQSVEPIFRDACMGCHGDGGGLDIEAGLAAMVDVPSNQSALDEIEPGSPEESYVWRKIEGTQDAVGGGGEQMPEGWVLPQEELETIRLWIEQGANP
ncbi:MAG: hypothetical protein ACOZNI_32910 [Myxococcota bacterium]